MANALYDKFKKLALDGDIDLLVDDIKVVLVDTATYSVDLNADDFLDDIPVGERVATSSNLSSKTTTDGTFDDGNLLTFSTVTGDECEAVVIYKDSGVAATSPLIAYIDTATGLPVTPNGGDITITWHANGIFDI
jgi:hypothetical protein